MDRRSFLRASLAVLGAGSHVACMHAAIDSTRDNMLGGKIVSDTDLYSIEFTSEQSVKFEDGFYIAGMPKYTIDIRRNAGELKISAIDCRATAKEFESRGVVYREPVPVCALDRLRIEITFPDLRTNVVRTEGWLMPGTLTPGPLATAQGVREYSHLLLEPTKPEQDLLLCRTCNIYESTPAYFLATETRRLEIDTAENSPEIALSTVRNWLHAMSGEAMLP